jgi:serine/threonine protein kinase
MSIGYTQVGLAPPEFEGIIQHIVQGVSDYINEYFYTNVAYVFYPYDQGYTAELYKFTVGTDEYLLKIYKDKSTKLPEEYYLDADSHLYLRCETHFVVDGYYCKIFTLLKGYINIGRFLDIHIPSPPATCYTLDTYRWALIYNVIELIKKLHEEHVYHRDLHLRNIMVEPTTLKLVLIDLDTYCRDDEECKGTIYNAHPYYSRKKYNQDELDHVTSINIDWYAVGMICLEILTYKKCFMADLSSDIKNGRPIRELIGYIYPKCSIHYKLVSIFIELILEHCLHPEGNTYERIRDNFEPFTAFYNDNFDRKRYFLINGEGYGTYFYRFVYTRIFEHIITHSFHNYDIFIFNQKDHKDQKDNKVFSLSRNEKVPYELIEGTFKIYDKYMTPSLIIRGPFYWFGKKNCNEWYDYDNDTVLKNIKPVKDRCVPDDPYQDRDVLKVPYLSISIEPLRSRLNPYQLPMLEINTLVKDKRNTKNVPSSYDTRLYKNVMWWGKQLYYFDNSDAIKNYWVPYLAHSYCDIVPFNKEDEPFHIYEPFLTKPKQTHFIFVATNCTSQIRNDLFKKLDYKDKSVSDQDRKVRSYGNCLNNMGAHPLEDQPCPYVRQGTAEVSAIWNRLPCIYNESKFTFAIENALAPGYITEKILFAFKANSVPIYYGPPEIKTIFNPNSFYYVNDKLKDPYNPTDAELNEIADELWNLSEDDSDTGWKKFLKEDKFIDGKVPDIFLYKTLPWMETLVNDIKLNYSKQVRELNADGKRLINLETEGRRKSRKNIKHKRKSKLKF